MCIGDLTLTNDKAKIISIKSDHGGEFENTEFEMFCDEHGIEHNFSTPRTLQQNGVVESKNRSLEEKKSNDTTLKKGNCCICYEMKVDSVLYR